MKRRAFLASLAAATAVPRLSWADAGSPAYLAAAQEPSGGWDAARWGAQKNYSPGVTALALLAGG